MIKLPILTKQQAEDLLAYISANLDDIDEDCEYCCASDAVDDLYARQERILDLIKQAANEQA